jgi:hypothetical protein
MKGLLFAAEKPPDVGPMPEDDESRHGQAEQAEAPFRPRERLRRENRHLNGRKHG